MAKTRRRLASTLRKYPDVDVWPQIGLGMDIVSTGHFRSRVALMFEQGMLREEIAEALQSPIEVKHNPAQSRYIYCGRRVAVVVKMNSPTDVVFVTALWASDRLWEKNPRPDRDAA